MQPIQVVSCVASALFGLLTLITLKLSLRRKVQPLLQRQQVQPKSVGCWQGIKFLLLRFTLMEVFAVRMAHLKLNQLLSLAVIAVFSLSLEQCYYWGWAVATILGMLVFLLAEVVVFKQDSKILEDETEHRKLFWRRPLLYAAYTLIAFVGFAYVAWSMVYVDTVWEVFGLNLGAMLLADQVIGRVSLSVLLGVATREWQPMAQLRDKYHEWERMASGQAAVGDEIGKDPAESASPSKKRNRRSMPSPSKIPKAPRPEDSSINQSKMENRPYQIDSMVNILECSHKKRIPKNKLPPMRPVFNESEVEIIDEINPNAKFQTPIRLVKRRENSQLLMSDIVKGIDDRVQPEIHELPGKDLNSKSRVVSVARDNDISSVIEKDFVNLDREESLMKQLQVYNHLTSNRSRILNPPPSADSRVLNQQPESLNTVQLTSKLSGRNNRPQLESPRDIIPKCHIQDENASIEDDPKRRTWLGNSNKRSIQNIEEELEEEEQNRNTPFQIRENTAEGEFEDEEDARRTKVLDLVRLEVRANKQDQYGLPPRNSVLEIREDDEEQLEEVDLNSPIKKKELSPEKVKQAITVSAKQKKKKNRKRDLRELRRLNSGSPYLQYLPNMLNKEVQQKDKDKRASLRQVGKQVQKQNVQDLRRGKSTRRINQQPKIEFQGNDINNQNRLPQDIVEDF